MAYGIEKRKVNWILDADIAKFFDRIDRDWMHRFLGERIGDQRLIRLIGKWLRMGAMEDGQLVDTGKGTPQGSVISPVLANIYLHYVLDLWVGRKWRPREARGVMIFVRYADDYVAGFQHRQDAERFLRDLKGRLGQFGLELHPDKTRLIEFGRFAIADRKKRGQGRPETFDFLGMTHCCRQKRNGLRAGTQAGGETHEPDPEGNPGEVATAHARGRGGDREMAGDGAARLVQLLRSADQLPVLGAVRAACAARMDGHSTPEVAKGPVPVGAPADAMRQAVAASDGAASVADPTICRHTSEVGAPCLNGPAGICA